MDKEANCSYEHLKNELVVSSKHSLCFKLVKECANENGIELNDEDFKRFFSLKMSGEDIQWIMHKMSAYNRTFVDALISYITY